MNLEKFRITRPLARKLLQIEDKLQGRPFPTMTRAKEISNYSCGPATLEMLLSFVGVKVTQKNLIKSIRAQDKIKIYGIDIKDMARATQIAGKKKLIFWKKENASINDIFQVIEKYKFPVGVEWQGDFYEHEDEDKGHYTVVTNVNKKSGYLRTADPYFNTFFGYNNLDRKYGIPEFIKGWWDTNEIKVPGSAKMMSVVDTRMMFVVTPAGEAWPKKLGMKKG